MVPGSDMLDVSNAPHSVHRHSRVTSVSVGDHLHNQRSLSGSSPLLGPLTSLLNGENVHSVDLKTWDLVSSGEELSVHGRSLGRSTHTVFVVLTHKDTWEVPQFGLKISSVIMDM